MESEDCRCARLIVEAILKDLTGRSGLDAMWESIPDEKRKEIQHGWYLKALEQVRQTFGATP